MGGNGSKSPLGIAAAAAPAPASPISQQPAAQAAPAPAAAQQAQPQQQLQVDGATVNQVATNRQAIKNNNVKFKAVDNADFHELYNGRQYYTDQSMSIDQRVAMMNYLSDQPSPGSLYSMSQNMNYKLANGQPLTANEQFVYNNVVSAMHNLGYNVNLTRYDHEGAINALLAANGVNKNYASMTEAQLKNALVGTQFQEKTLLSTSYNDFRNAGASASVFNTRVVRIRYRAKAKTQAVMPGDGPGGKLGEIILGNTNSFRVVDVKFDSRKVRHKGTQNYTAKGVTLYIDVE